VYVSDGCYAVFMVVVVISHVVVVTKRRWTALSRKSEASCPELQTHELKLQRATAHSKRHSRFL